MQNQPWGLSSGDQMVVSGFASRDWTRLFVALMSLGLGVYLLVLAATPGGYVLGRWIGGVFGTLMLALAVISLVEVWQARRPLELRGDDLRVYDGVLRIRTIPLSEISGVGLALSWIYGRSGRAPGWYLTIWDANGKPFPVEKSCLKAQGTNEDFRAIPPRVKETADELAASDAGRLARALYDRVWSVQGSSGPLATRQEQKMRDKDVWTRDPSFYGFWSPDGELTVFEPVS